jgi:hypothetical protein
MFPFLFLAGAGELVFWENWMTTSTLSCVLTLVPIGKETAPTVAY